MMRALVVSSMLAAATTRAAAQGSLAARAGAVRDGVVRMQYAARPGVCGDGHDMVSIGHAYFSRQVESWGTHSNAECRPGPLRVAITMDGGRPVRFAAQVGGNWRAVDGVVTDLGEVSSREASAYLFSLVPTLEKVSYRDRLILSAALAADAPVVEPLKALARNEDRTTQTRRQAIQFLAIVGDASVIPDLVRFARNRDAGEKSLSGAAVAALAELPDDAGVPALIGLSRDSSSDVRHEVVFWLGQTEDPRAVRRLHEVIDDRSEENRVRKNAIFALSQSDATPTKDLVAVYRALDDATLKEQAIFALSQRDDDTAVESLISIAKEDHDKRMRGKALFWLAQKNDPRVTKLLSDILVK